MAGQGWSDPNECGKPLQITNLEELEKVWNLYVKRLTDIQKLRSWFFFMECKIAESVPAENRVECFNALNDYRVSKAFRRKELP